MSKHVLVIDTSVLCCWLKVPGKDEAGPLEDRWDFERIDEQLRTEVERGSTLVLPIATLIETGNHIAQAPSHRHRCAGGLSRCLRQAAEAESPWAAFTDQSPLWQPENLNALAHSWPALANAGITIGDATIKDVAEYYAKAGYTVEIITGDEGLKAYEPIKPVNIPRRRGGR